MAEDDDRPEDDIDDDDDSDLFQPPPPDKAEDKDASPEDAPGDPLSDALAEGAAGDDEAESGDQEEEPGDEDDGELFAQEEEGPLPGGHEPGGHEPVLPTTDEEDEDTDADAPEVDEDVDLFSESADTDEEEDEDQDAGDDDEEPSGGARQRYPWLQTSGEEEEEELEEEHFLQGRALIIVGAGVVFVIFAALIWFLYAQGGDAPRDEEVALIEAPEGPAKVEPEDRGGMEVPDQDKLVFDRVSGEETEVEENLLDGPEETMAVPESSQESASESLDQLVDALVQEEVVADAGAEEEAVAAPPVETPAVAAEPAPEPVAAPAAPVTAGGTHVVQLGSFGSADRAETAWRIMKNRHSITLAGMGNDIQRADLGARGIFYRLRTDALGLDDAQDLCADLKADGQDCLVVRK
ncbi:MAG: SPOR domain-containing protein [Proteobacteria bacterium]|nr:SPOR domain-containing protein [Pseudomonadota bacterium]